MPKSIQYAVRVYADPFFLFFPSFGFYKRLFIIIDFFLTYSLNAVRWNDLLSNLVSSFDLIQRPDWIFNNLEREILSDDSDGKKVQSLESVNYVSQEDHRETMKRLRISPSCGKESRQLAHDNNNHAGYHRAYQQLTDTIYALRLLREIPTSPILALHVS